MGKYFLAPLSSNKDLIEAGCFYRFYVHQNGACRRDCSAVGPHAIFGAEVTNEVEYVMNTNGSTNFFEGNILHHLYVKCIS